MEKSMLDKLLKFGVDKGASDIHFQVGSPPCYRVKGELLRAKTDVLNTEMMVNVAKILLTDREIDPKRFFPEQDASYSLPGVSRFRVSVFRQRGSIGCVLRVIPFRIQSFEELNLPEVIQQIAGAPRGLILVTGATGNGKSTTIASMLRYIAGARFAHILTIEDPIEFLFETSKSLIVQREVGTDTLSYKEGMIAALRQDPDVIMLGEVRDDFTADVCLKAAETGHLVISSLHTPDAVSTIKRFSGFFDPARTETELGRLAESLQAVICLRLQKRADGQGLVPAVEILRVTHTMQECIRQMDKHADIYQHIVSGNEAYNMQTFDQHLKELVQKKMITIEVAKQAASNPSDLERSLMVE